MMNTTTSLHSFKSIQPQFQGPQNELVDWILNLHSRSMELAEIPDRDRLRHVLKRFCVSEKQIQKRFYEIDRDFIYQISKNAPSGTDIGVRHEFYKERSLEIVQKMYLDAEIPEHLIHVTCTGYLAPSSPQIYFSEKAKAPDVTHAYHMGCYASLPAVRMADAFVQSKKQQVDILHTEMCSLHLDPARHSPEQMVVQSLFADGHMKYTADRSFTGRRMEVLAVKEKIIPGSAGDMTWVPSPTSMQMTLSKEVPEKIRGHLPAFLREMTQDPFENIIFAIHPGGPKIIDSIQSYLELSDEQVAFSRKVLKERGNMSSATLPHVWKEILDSDYSGKVISLAFGPGLTIFGGLFTVKS
jgi:predicted naringenin-chalcone synthase